VKTKEEKNVKAKLTNITLRHTERTQDNLLEGQERRSSISDLYIDKNENRRKKRVCGYKERRI